MAWRTPDCNTGYALGFHDTAYGCRNRSDAQHTRSATVQGHGACHAAGRGQATHDEAGAHAVRRAHRRRGDGLQLGDVGRAGVGGGGAGGGAAAQARQRGGGGHLAEARHGLRGARQVEGGWETV